MSSNIIPGNIDGAFPVAGQDNSSQGFRDNFTAIKNNFNFVKKRFEKIQNVRLYKQYFDKFCQMYSGKFDFIYIDANNSFESVYKYLRDAEKLLNDDGIIGINDYSIYQECGLADVKEEIGVVKAVNKFLRNNLEWYVYAFSFNDKLTSDIYLKKSTTNLLFR